MILAPMAIMILAPMAIMILAPMAIMILAPMAIQNPSFYSIFKLMKDFELRCPQFFSLN